MLMKTTMRVLAAVAVVALSAASVDAGDSTMSLGDGTTVNTTSKTTIFLGTEYNPDKCVLQFNSLQCKLEPKDDCGALNGYPLECVKLGLQNGKQKVQCQCRANETDVCQSSTAASSGIPQFGDCSEEKPCTDSYGHVSSALELRICAEKIHCVKEINTTATVPAQICHTCRSCIAQNDASNTKLSDKRRFDCTKICPKEVLDSIAKRNQQGVGIADELSSGEDSSSGSGSDEGSMDGSNETAAPTGSKADSTSAAVPSVSSVTVVATIVVASLSAVVML